MGSNDLAEKCSSSVYECLQERRMPTRSYEHLVGAYGAVGSSGVKDARRASSMPTLSRRPADRCRVTVHWTNAGQRLDVYWTSRLH